MRATLSPGDDLVSETQACTGLKEKSALVRETPKGLTKREAAHRLDRLGGIDRKLADTAATLWIAAAID